MNNISQLIISFFNENKRNLPFREKKDPYHILLSEVIMQQTRMEQGTPYFLRILKEFPTLNHLAASDPEQLLRLWQGLGYYSRAKNLHETAVNIIENHGGLIPGKYDELKKLKGIGDYTAAAIASIAFNEAVPVIDGNVMRVIARLFALNIPVNSREGREKIRQYLEKIFSEEQPGLFNEAIMEFGALQCIPAHPDCEKCILKNHCRAYKSGNAADFPVKLPPKEIQERWMNYIVPLYCNTSITIMKKRSDDDIWKNLYEFPLIETKESISDNQLSRVDFWESLNIPLHEILLFEKTLRYRHKLSHRLLKVSFTPVKIKERPENISLNNGFSFITFQEVEKKPKPVLFVKFLKTAGMIGS